MPIISSINASLIVRNDKAETWAAKNPVLLKGELGAEIDTGLLKLGDGTSSFNDLEYINEKMGSGGTISGALVLDYTPTEDSHAVNKGYVDAAINAANHLSRSIVSELPPLAEANDNTIYMVKDDSITSGDAYREYMVIEGVLTQIGDTSVNLTNYLQKPSLFAENNVAVFSESGDIIDSGKSINEIFSLAPATTTVIGGVLSSAEDNSVTVNADGTMSVNNISVHKLYVPEGDEFILNGGAA